jgi:hypothetical protein
MALPEDPAAAVEALTRSYPGWIFWLSDIGRVWANSREERVPLGCRHAVDADTPDELEHLVIDQERLRGRPPAPKSVELPERLHPIPPPWSRTEPQFRAGDPT